MTTIIFDGNELFVYTAAPLIVAGILGVFAYFRRKFRCIDKVDERLTKIEQRTERQSHAQIATNYRQDEITSALHPDSPIKSNLGPLTESLLKDDKGNL